MVRRATVDDAQVNVGAGGLGEALEKVLGQFGLEIANALGVYLATTHAIGTAPQIDRCSCEGFVHGHQEISGAQDASLCTERLEHRFSERDACVFDGVVLIDVEIAFGCERQVEGPMACNEIEHVIEKTDSGGDARGTSPIEIQTDVDVRLVGFTMDCGGPWHFF